MKKFVSALFALVLVISLVLTGCSKATNKDEKDNGNVAKEKGADFKIGMVTDTGGVDDKSFNQSAWEGLTKLKKETGASVKYLQSNTPTDYDTNLNTMIKNGFNLTWGTGFTLGDAIKKAAQENPEANIAIIDNIIDEPNVVSVTFAENEGSFLVGVVAGLMTETNKIGFVGGQATPVIKNFQVGFEEGIKMVNPDADIKINYTGVWDKADMGKSAAAVFYNEGVDIIFHAAGATGKGVFSEAQERQKKGKKAWVIGVDKDQSLEFGNEVTLTSMIKRVDEAVYRVSEQLIDGKYKGGEHIVLNLSENGVSLPEKNPNIPEDVLLQVEDYKQKIIAGEIKVTSAYQ